MRILTELIDLVLPADCLCCGRPGTAWCAACQPASVPRRVELPGGPCVFAAGDYAEQLRTALLAYKERGRRQLVGQLAGYLADALDCAVRAAAPDSPALVPVPSSRAAARSRGGDHVLRLAAAVARQAELPLLPVLSLTGPVRDSAGLTAGQRRSNLAGRMIATGPAGAGGRCPILLDDIVTTGSTLAEAGRALAAAGWPVGGAAVVAATRLRRAAEPPAAGRARASPGRPAEPAAPQLSTGQIGEKGLAFN